MRQWAIILTSVFCAITLSSEACTGLRLKAKDGSAVHGRTLEFGIIVDTTVQVVPRGYAFTATTPLGDGLKYTAKYASVGVSCFGSPDLMDGMNEKGLSIGTFYFPTYAKYTPTTKDNIQKSLSPIDFPNWILSQFATLDEVREGIKNVVIAPTIAKAWGPVAAPFHYIVYDKSGRAITIEPINGTLEVKENPIGTFTNSPNIDWHLTNLRNFINLTPINVKPLAVDGIELAPFGQGSGMVGLPGDFTPPSRFVRASIYSITAIPSDNADQSVFQLFHILNQFDIPVGAARSVEDGVTYSDFTQATVVHDPSNLKYYFRTYDDQTIRLADLKTFDLNAKEIKKMDTKGTQPYVDISKDLK
ncbi:MAG: linear amide C-N hydrolase [Parachlamydiaceae bacterium]